MHVVAQMKTSRMRGTSGRSILDARDETELRAVLSANHSEELLEMLPADAPAAQGVS